jgi:hypothetical protein
MRGWPNHRERDKRRERQSDSQCIRDTLNIMPLSNGA